MSIKKRRLGFTLLLLVVILIAACSKNDTNTSNQPDDKAASTTTTQKAPATEKKDTTTSSESTSSEAPDPYAPFEDTLTIRIAQQLPPGETFIPQGETVEDNVMTRFYEEALNIKLEREWNAVSGEPYDQKVMLSIASRDLPDAMKVNEEQLRLLVQADLIQDLSEVYEQYASPTVKRYHDLAEGQALAAATFDGKLYGIPNISILGDAITQLYVRKDWLDELGLPEPKSLADIEKIAKAFAESGKSKYGISGPNTPELSNDKGNRTHGFDAIFSSFHAFPRHWLYDENGDVTYGSIEPEAKEALGLLRQWYADGIIDPEFFLRENPDEVFLSGQVGMFFGPWWMAWGSIGNMFEQFPEAEWKAYAAPVDADGQFVSHSQAIAREFLVIRKDYATPEAVMKGVNLKIGIDRQALDEVPADLFDRYHAEVVPTNISNTLDIFRVVTDDIYLVATQHQRFLDALAGKLAPEELGAEFQKHFDIGSPYIDDTEVYKYYPQAIADGYSLSQIGAIQAYIIGGRPNTQVDKLVSSLLYSPTETMRSRWANLTKLEDETFLRIVIGEAPLDAFDSFVQEWRNLGGDQILKEVTEIVKP